MDTKEEFDVNQTLAEVVKSKDIRLWEGFSVLLVNAAQEFSFDYNQVMKFLPNKQEQRYFKDLLQLSFALYQHYRLTFIWVDRLKKQLTAGDNAFVQKLKNCISRGELIHIGQKSFLPDRLFKMFNNYFKKDAEKAKRLNQKYEELSLEYSLSQLFSPKQKELFKKKLHGELLNKTEREYYSRTVKKKVSALANADLHRLAQKLMVS
ncbi:MAG: hypothetical protein KJN80_03155 [Deltaproteobacteria bacterium]|nr:hypothetical protein [Deltaproteobacteria bacterium]NNK85091.1 hypothetical protein [Desulfobacterales bacterium]